jgi:hypothetical protein
VISTILWDVGGTLLQYAASVEQFIYSCLVDAGVPLGLLDAESFHQAEQFRKHGSSISGDFLMLRSRPSQRFVNKQERREWSLRYTSWSGSMVKGSHRRF